MTEQKESKRDKFVRLAEYRMNRLLGNIEQLGMLANKQSYEFTGDDCDAIVDTLMLAVRDMQVRFAEGKPAVTGWTLDQ